MSLELKGNIIFKGKIVCKTGIHIGGSKDKMEIGGIDSPVIRDPYTNYPYIPGSSIKGKARSMLELLNSNIDRNGKVWEKPDCAVTRLFGTSANQEGQVYGPTRLIFRDAFPDKETIIMWENLDSELLYTEHKVENTINRIDSSAMPRDLERIIAGSKFDFEMVFTIYDGFENSDNHPDTDFIKDALNSLKLVQDTFLGGSGSRGYGKVEIIFNEIIFYSKDYYQNKSEAKKIKIDTLVNINELDPDKVKELIA